MKFVISCEQFNRLSRGAYIFGEDLGLNAANKPHEVRPALCSVLLENYNGNCYAIVSNGVIMAIELLSETSEPNGQVAIRTDPALIAQCKAEMLFTADLVVTFDPATGVANVVSTFGFVYPGNANVGLPWPGKTWHELLTAVQAKPEQAAAVTVSGAFMARLASTAPSGDFVFPKVVSRSQPVFVRDDVDASWLGIFLLQRSNMLFATLPDWAKK